MVLIVVSLAPFVCLRVWACGCGVVLCCVFVACVWVVWLSVSARPIGFLAGLGCGGPGLRLGVVLLLGR